MSRYLYWQRICKGCKHKAKHHKAWYCKLTGKNLAEYNDIDECNNHSERSDEDCP